LNYFVVYFAVVEIAVAAEAAVVVVPAAAKGCGLNNCPI